MSPDSFLLDPFLLFANGFLIALVWQKYGRPHGVSRVLPYTIGALTLGIFWVVSISLFLDLPWTDGFARWCGARTGRDWMLNSGVFHFDYTAAPSLGLKAFAGAFFVSYFVWIELGARLGVRIGSRPAPGR